MRNCPATIVYLFLCVFVGCPFFGQTAVAAGEVNAFNPYINTVLPSTRQAFSDNAEMLRQMGADAHRIENEAAYRRHWREELYPVVFGDARAPHEILILLDFAEPLSEKAWQAVVTATRSLSPTQTKVVVFGNSKEKYGTDLMGFAIWLSYSHKTEVMPWLGHSLARWNAIKAGQKHLKGRAVPFDNEYDATLSPGDYPMIYSYVEKMRPRVPLNEEQALSRYCYEAGNVNLYQATQVSEYYEVKALPAVIVDGRHLDAPSAETIILALKQN
jgi:hypothetical protein